MRTFIGEIAKQTTPRPKDPLIRAAEKAYRSTDAYALDKLLLEESRWKRKQTIARNKLEEVRDKISKLAQELPQKVVKL